ncbi:retropepsin-like aspartic peptidase RloA3 [Modicisalibacter luteus]|uniref:ATP-dependent zinc protease n=1 Tax=Modicisalibacter luteus TaxID=453962 RepID=A0ABV7M2W5_9GAMM|nr:RimK/LysX family protein [Halomonas lutea]GHA85315.1 ATP-dependent Zn protease [Halomonas lutea]
MYKEMQKALVFSIVSVLLVSPIAQADENAQSLGWVEKASIVPWGAVVKAKLDTGALTSSLQAENIDAFEKNHEEWVRFTVEVEDEASNEVVERRFEKPLFRDLTVRGAGGKEERAVVLMNICIGEEIYEEQFSLEDRDDMIYPVLLGRRTIQSLGPVDVTKTFTRDPGCNEDSPVQKHIDKEYDEDIGD